MLHKVNWNEQTVSTFWNDIDVLIQRQEKTNDYFAHDYAKQLLKMINKMIHFKNKKVLDYGCGRGDLIHILCNDYDLEIVNGCDISQESVDFVNRSNSGNKRFGGAVRIESKAIPYQNENFDVILLTELIEHLNDRDLEFAVSEISRMLKKNGVVVVTTPNEENLKDSIVVCPECECYFHRVQHMRSWSVQTLEKYFSRYGIRMIKNKQTTLRIEDSILKKLYSHIYNFMLKLLNRKGCNLIFIGQKVCE